MSGRNTRLLQRYEVIEWACLRVTAGWAMATTAGDVKVMLGLLPHVAGRPERRSAARPAQELRSGPLARKQTETDEGDTVSESYLLYDICDETRHVANGRRWIGHWQQATGDTRTQDQLLADVRALLQARITYIGTGNSSSGLEGRDDALQYCKPRCRRLLRVSRRGTHGQRPIDLRLPRG